MAKELLLIKTNIIHSGINLEGLALFTKEEWTRYIKTVSLLFKTTSDLPARCAFGNHEDIYFQNLSQYKKQVKTKKISSRDAIKLMSILNIKLNDGKNSKSNYFSSFGCLTLMQYDRIHDEILDQGNYKEAKWIRENGCQYAESYIEEFYTKGVRNEN